MDLKSDQLLDVLSRLMNSPKNKKGFSTKLRKKCEKCGENKEIVSCWPDGTGWLGEQRRLPGMAGEGVPGHGPPAAVSLL